MKKLSSPQLPLELLFRLRISTIVVFFSFTGCMLGYGQATTWWFDVNPSKSNLDATNPNGASGGRINHLGAASNLSVVYAATEWGGLWKSNNVGRNWEKVYSFTPDATWDVKVDFEAPNIVFVTSFFDGRINGARSGISYTYNGGQTWSTAPLPPAGFCKDAARQTQQDGWQISIDPEDADVVYVGTSCGLAVTRDGGISWNYIDPSTGDAAEQVYSVLAHGKGIVDVITDNGHWRSLNKGVTWTTAQNSPIPGGISDLAVSPDEDHVLFATVGTDIYESDNGGASWPFILTNPRAQGRVPFVSTNNLNTTNGFDLWFGDVNLNRTTCVTASPPAPGGPRRSDSNNWSADFSTPKGAHNDAGDLLFDPRMDVNACPLLYANDGGVYYNTKRGLQQNCNTPSWEQPSGTPHATWLFGFEGRETQNEVHGIYYGLQDNGTWGATNVAGDLSPAIPSWTNSNCCDGFDNTAAPNRITYSVGSFSQGRSFRIIRAQPDYSGAAQINNYPSNSPIISFTNGRAIVQYSGNGYALNLDDGVYTTPNIVANPINWTNLGDGAGTQGGLKVSSIGNTIYLLHFVGGRGRPYDTGRIKRYQGVAGGGNWTQLPLPPNMVTFTGAYDVNPRNPSHLMVTALDNNNQFHLWKTLNYGVSWTEMQSLNNLMTDNGNFMNPVTKGRRNSLRAGGLLWQPYMIEIDPKDPDVVLAGGVSSGVFLSTTFGDQWERISDINAPTTVTPHIPRPLFAHFGDTRNLGTSSSFDAWIGSQGFGITKVVASYGVAN